MKLNKEYFDAANEAGIKRIEILERRVKNLEEQTHVIHEAYPLGDNHYYIFRDGGFWRTDVKIPHSHLYRLDHP